MDRSSNETLFQRRHTDGQRNMKRYPTLLIIRKMQIEITMRYHFTLVRMTNYQKDKKQQVLTEFGKKGTLWHCWWECKLV